VFVFVYLRLRVLWLLLLDDRCDRIESKK